MSDETTYQGSCHCGAVRFEATTPEIKQAMSCNCSICRRRGSLLAFVPAGAFRLTSDASPLADYQFNTMSVHHHFCTICGISGFFRGAKPDGTEVVGLNVRCIDAIDLDTLKIVQFDGKSL